MTTTTETPPQMRTPPELYAADERRIDGDQKVRGTAAYTADFSRPEMLWAAFVPSALPYAKITSIDTRAARAMPGVHAVLTGADIGRKYFGRRLFDWPVLAYEVVRFVGEYVVAVAAETREIAELAAASVDIEYEELEPQFNPQAALDPDAPVMHPDRDTFPFVPPKPWAVPHANMQGYDRLESGDVDSALATSDHVFEHSFRTPRYHAGYIEPHATLVWLEDDVVHVVATHKGPFNLRDALAVCTGLPKDKIVVEPSFVGGEFGAKGISVEAFAMYFLAVAAKRPIKYVRTYLDDVRSTTVRHASEVTVRTGVKNDGTIVALDVRAIFDGGAYAAGKVVPSVLPGIAPKLPYRIDAVRVERIAVYTNTVPGGFVRAPGDVQILFAVESHLDMIARELNIDPLELRLRNVIADGDSDVDGLVVRNSNVGAILERLREMTDWGEALRPGTGRGIALIARHISGGSCAVGLNALPNGDVNVDVGAVEPGVGTLTVVQRVVAGELGLAPERVHITRQATDIAPFDPGIGGSRGTHLLGQAALAAASNLRTELERAHVSERGHHAIAAIAKGGPIRVVGEYTQMADLGWLNFCGYVITVTVDEETGHLEIDDVAFVAEVGTIVNPVAHRGQIDGGFLMGLGHATMEELVLEDGRITNLSLADYKLPTQRDMPPHRVELIHAAGGPGPYGARAAGEINVAGVAPALANAIDDACGVRINQLPITAERIYNGIKLRQPR